ncbi:MAG: glycerophosphodiester phosphodiesterase [Planctomycetales bacterium]|nr:glycerophosphodiester phosphodiesterase [Planctomycetales bacterium]
MSKRGIHVRKENEPTWGGAIMSAWAGLKPSLPVLIATDLMYKLLAYLAIAPAFVVLFRTLLRLSGNKVLSDIDIAYFLIGPFGWVCGILLGGIWLAIFALEQTSLLWILSKHRAVEHATMIDALRFAFANTSQVMRVTVRIISRSVLVVAPFAVIAFLSYDKLLTEFDINYYLKERPREFQTFVGIGCLLAVGLMAVSLRLFAGWFLALPLVLFEQTLPRRALAESQALMHGHRRSVVLSMVFLLIIVVVANSVVNTAIGLAGHFLIPAQVGSIALLAARIGGMLLVSAIAGMLIHLVTAIGFAGTMYQTYTTLSPAVVSAVDASHAAAAAPIASWPRLTARRLVLATVMIALGVTGIGYKLVSDVRFKDDLKVMAHRGASALAPENTLASYRQAIADGADWIEIDVQETADGEVVVVHDQDLMKLASNPVKVWQATRQELSTIDIGSWFDSQFSGERIASLREVLQLCKHQVGVNIELKYYGHDQQLEQRVVDIVEGEGMADHVMVMSLKPEGIAKMRSLRPQWKSGLLLSIHIGNLKEIEADFLAVNAEFASRSFVQKAHRAGKEVYVWTVDDPAEMSALMNRDVDGILTNRPDLARDVLRQRSTLSSSERLLAEISLWLGI